MIQLQNLTAGKGNVPIIKNIDWQIEPGQHWAIIGDMGSGKTTLQETLIGKTRIFDGTTHYHFLKNPTSYEERKKAIKLVSFTDTSKLFRSVNAVHYYQQRYQAFDSAGHLTVLEYLETEGLDLEKSAHRDFIKAMQIEALLKLERIKLSSGQLRKVLLLKALLQAPNFLLLDNAHLGLDHESRKTLNKYIDHLASQEHQQIIMSGQTSTLPSCITHVLQLEQGRIMGIEPASKKTIAKKSKEFPIVNDDITAYYNGQDSEDFASVLQFDKIAIKYQDKQIIKEIDWTVKKGEKWSVQGPNGVGKSTLLSLIYGDHPQAYSNKISLFDRPRGSGESIWQIKKRIGYTSPELHSYFSYDFKVFDVILSGLSDTFYVDKTTNTQIKIAELFLQYFDLPDKKLAPFNTLSTGQQRLILFIRSLIKAPAVLILDEPYQGMDTHTIRLCNILLCQLLTDKHTLIFISHFQDEVPAVVNMKMIL